jgi:hypothetical protein
MGVEFTYVNKTVNTSEFRKADLWRPQSTTFLWKAKKDDVLPWKGSPGQQYNPGRLNATSART